MDLQLYFPTSEEEAKEILENGFFFTNGVMRQVVYLYEEIEKVHNMIRTWA